jgi:cyclophilin family peptidyl-prolyl cis-trans isomerase
MNKRYNRIILFSLIFTLISCTSPGGNENTVFLMKTTLGDIKIRLYDETPVHRDNFIKLINSGFYEGVSFHRIINGFMIQAGDPGTRSEKYLSSSDSINNYTIPAEFVPSLFHKKGALAAARQGNNVNPEMRSSGTQFYLVQGVKYSDDELELAQQRINNNLKQSVFSKYLKHVADSGIKAGTPFSDGEIQERASARMFQYLSENKEYVISEEQRTIYKNLGGVPRLDGTYTVFGEILEGLDVVDKIAAVETDKTDKPLSDIKILKIKIVD